MLPSLITDLQDIYETSETSGTHLESLITSFLGWLSLLIGNSVLFTPDGMLKVHPNLFTVILGTSGDTKSPHLNIFKSIIEEIYKDKIEQRSFYFKEVLACLPLSKKGKKTSYYPSYPSICPLESSAIPHAPLGVPENPEYFVYTGDYTIPSLHADAALASFGNLPLYHDELFDLFKNIDSGNSECMRKTLIQSYEHGGGIYKVQRKTAEFKIPEIFGYCSTLIGTLQKSGFDNYVNSYVKKNVGHGFLARIQNVSLIPAELSYANYPSMKLLPPLLRAKIKALFTNIMDFRIAKENTLLRSWYMKDHEPFFEAYKTVPEQGLSSESLDYWNYLRSIYNKSHYSESIMQEYIAKSRSNVLRIAGLFHILEHGAADLRKTMSIPISLETLKSAHEYNYNKLTNIYKLYNCHESVCSLTTSLSNNLLLYILDRKKPFYSTHSIKGFTLHSIKRANWKILPRDINGRQQDHLITEALDYLVEIGSLVKSIMFSENNKQIIVYKIKGDSDGDSNSKEQTTATHTDETEQRGDCLHPRDANKDRGSGKDSKVDHRQTFGKNDLSSVKKESFQTESQETTAFLLGESNQEIRKGTCLQALDANKNQPYGQGSLFSIKDLKQNNSIEDYLEEQGYKKDKKGKYPCPFHGKKEKSRSFSVYLDANDLERFKCHGSSCGASGDILDLKTHIEGLSLQEQLNEQALAPRLAPLKKEKPKKKKDRKTKEEFAALWEKNKLLYTEAKASLFPYLINNRLKGIEVPLPSDIIMSDTEWGVSMFAAIRRDVDGEIIAFQTNPLNSGLNDVKRDKEGRKLTYCIGSPKEGAVLLHKGSTGKVCIVEGIETGMSLLALKELYGVVFSECTLLAALSLNNIGSLSLPEETKEVYLFTDKGSSVHKKSLKAKEHYEKLGYLVFIHSCPVDSDWNDFLKSPVDIAPVVSYKLVDNFSEAILEAPIIGIDFETSGLDANAGAEIMLIQASNGVDPVEIINVQKGNAYAALKPLIGKKLVAHNASFERSFAPYLTLMCTQQANFLLTGKRYASLAELSVSRLKKAIVKDLQTSDWTSEPTKEQLHYAALDASIVLELWFSLEKEIIETKQDSVYALISKVDPIVGEIEQAGIYVDVPAAEALLQENLVKLGELEDEKENLSFFKGEPYYLPPSAESKTTKIFREWLSNNIIDQSKWPRTPKGLSLSSNADALIVNKHLLSEPAQLYIEKYIEPKSLIEKQITDIRQYLEGVKPSTSRIHAKLNVLGADTGRFSSSNPNLQNVQRCSRVRSLFKASPGHKLIVGDYSQIELRMAAHVINCQALLKAYENGDDIHKKTIASFLKKSIQEVTPKERTLAKAINFGFLFGQRAKGFIHYAKRTFGVEVSLEEASKYRTWWFTLYPEVFAYHKSIDEALWQSPYVYSPMGLRRDYTLKNGQEHWQVVNSAINHAIQGGAAEVMMNGIIRTRELLQGTGASIVLTVHDELLVEAPERETDKILSLVDKGMSQGMLDVFPKANVSGLVDLNIINDWSEK